MTAVHRSGRQRARPLHCRNARRTYRRERFALPFKAGDDVTSLSISLMISDTIPDRLLHRSAAMSCESKSLESKVAGAQRHLLRQQELFQEHRRHGRDVVAVVLLGEAVAFVVGVDGPDGRPLFLRTLAAICSASENGTRGSFLPWATSRAERILSALFVGLIRSKTLRIFGIALVAIFGPPQIAAVRAGVLRGT